MDINQFEKGWSTTITVAVTPDQVEYFAQANNDRNPIHFDDAAAKLAGFPQGCIVQGDLVASLANSFLVELLPGVILLERRSKFKHEAYVGQQVRFEITLKNVIKQNDDVSTSHVLFFDVTYYSMVGILLITSSVSALYSIRKVAPM